MKVFSTPLSLQRGVAHTNGQPRLLVSADYPYYRDYRQNWADRLARLKALGITVITAYIPWRHHQLSPTTEPDFSGQTQPNRDVLAFLSLCQELELAVIAKPGPFIHAETNYGGLPNWVCPLNDSRIEPLVDSQNQPVCWAGAQINDSGTASAHWPLPAPLSPVFLDLTREWLARVGEQVIKPNQSPVGPIIAVQVANEGIYSNGQHAPWAYDYSLSGLARYRQHLQTQYGSLENYNKQNATHSSNWDDLNAPVTWQPEEWQTYLDWGTFQAEYMRLVFHEWSRPLQTSLPVIVNQNPPLADDFGLDAWLTRVEPERWPEVHYGFTNWVGDISANSSAFDRYLLTAKRYPGLNMEENWGFAELYDPAYADAATCFYQTLVALNGGATGFNIYTGVATAHPDHNLEVLPKAPYPDAAPITEEGALTPKAEIARWLVKFMDCYGGEFLTCQPVQPAAWGLYLPHARIGAWVPAAQIGPHTPALGHHLQQFQSQMRQLHLDYGILNLETASLEDCLKYPRLVATGGPFMGKAVQAKLAEYVRQGGKLAIIGALPSHDEAFEPCALLAPVQDRVHVSRHVELAEWLADVERPCLTQGKADVWIRSHPQRDLHFVTILIPAQGDTQAQIELRAGACQHHVQLSAAPSGGVLLRIEQGRVTAALIKGHNGYLGQSVAPDCVFDDQKLGLSAPGDFAWIDGWKAHLAPQ